MSNIAFEVKEAITALQQRILEQHPEMPVLLRKIHTVLKQDPEVVTLLEDEEIGTIISGLKIQTNTVIATSIATKKSGKSSAKITLDDL